MENEHNSCVRLISWHPVRITTFVDSSFVGGPRFLLHQRTALGLTVSASLLGHDDLFQHKKIRKVDLRCWQRSYVNVRAKRKVSAGNLLLLSQDTGDLWLGCPLPRCSSVQSATSLSDSYCHLVSTLNRQYLGVPCEHKDKKGYCNNILESIILSLKSHLWSAKYSFKRF